jgi:membrane protease YdiL (CAAX protease family)
MSICPGLLTAAATTTTPTTQPAPGGGELFLAAILLLIGLTLAFAFGTFRRGSVLGPTRLDKSDSPLRMLAIAFLGIGIWLTVGAVYMTMAHGKEILDARQRGLEYTPPIREAAMVNVVAQLLALVTVLRADQLLIRGGIAKLGFARRDLAPGLVAGFAGATVALPLTLSASIFITTIWFTLKFRPPQDHQLIRMLFDDHDRIVRWLVVFSAVFVAPVFEETIFRGHVQTLIAHTLRIASRPLSTELPAVAPVTDDATQPGPVVLEYASSPPLRDAPWIRWLAICVAAGLFAVIHEASWMMPPLFLLAVCFGYVYERTGKLWAPILMHALFNAVSIALALFTRG